ncbi:hypothetical protein [Streptomyces sp. NPDC005538]|uniref:hypothetical protein n=1 Tax=unclassified Streptomyces TaxID=2593676 RepID=UPI0033ABEC1A
MEDGQSPRITFRSPLGQAWARWRGSEAPRGGDAVDVEIDIPDDVVNWVHGEGPDALVADMLGAPVRIKGAIAGGAEDAVVAIRVGADILLVEFAAVGQPEGQGRIGKPSFGNHIELSVPHIDVYPYSV